MKRFLKNLIIIVLFLSGLSLLLYPFVSNQWNTYRQKQLITTYDQKVAEVAEKIDYQSEWDRAYAYNEALLPSILPDSFAIAAAAEEPDKEYMACLNLTGDGIIGHVEIPKINVRIPIYHTVKEEVLQVAAGHLEGSSLPCGGPSTHAVVSAHRGLPSATLFTDLDQLVVGDHFLFYVLDDVLCYEVDLISVVEPSDTEALQVEDGEDLATLLTCTPYGVNSHRLLVRGHRVDYEPEVVEAEEVNTTLTNLTGTSLRTNYLLWVVVGLSVTGLFILILYLNERRLRKKMARKRRYRQRKNNP